MGKNQLVQSSNSRKCYFHDGGDGKDASISTVLLAAWAIFSISFVTVLFQLYLAAAVAKICKIKRSQS